MAKDLTSYQRGIVNRYYEHQDTIQTTKLSEIVSDLWLADDEKTKTKLWGKAQIALMRVGIDANQVAGIVGKRDLEGLAKLVAQADAGTAKKPPAPGSDPGSDPSAPKGPTRVPQLTDNRTVRQLAAQKAAESGFDSLEEDNLKRALKAFRRKLKTIKRDDESRLGGRYVSAGRVSDICAIQPPPEFPAPVWEKLVEQGRLKRAGQGTLQLP